MKKLLVLTAFLLPIGFAGCSHPQPVAYYAPPPPPLAWTEIARQGYRDGVEAARHDIAAGKAPDFARHGRFRNPPVPPPAFEDFRHGFREGYGQTFHRGA